MTAPVVLISFNRPDATRRTLQQIREAAPAGLFLIADGPRPGYEGDASKCNAVRRELGTIDWPCQVSRRYNDENRGVDATVELGLDWVFDQVDDAIILEDDCLPNADFFPFSSELLERYRATESVWHIAGRAPDVPPEAFAGASYMFTAFGPIWGWATWRRAWSSHRERFPRLHDGSPLGSIRPNLSGSRLLTRRGRRYFTDVGRDAMGNNFRWDSYWCLSVVRERGLVVIPKPNLIENIGFGTDASNTRTPVDQRPLEAVEWPLRHPAELAVNPDVERLAERLIASHHGRAVRAVARMLGDGRARDAARSAVRTWRQWRAPAQR